MNPVQVSTRPAPRWRQWLGWLQPVALPIDARERWRVALGVGFGVLVAGLLSWTAAGSVWLAAPLGASAVIVFALPTSPLAQPWAVVGGNAVSALVGIAVVHAVPQGVWPPLAPALAAGLAVGAMLALRCLHPPGAAVALVAVLSLVTQWRFAWMPVALNSVLLVAAGTVYNRLTGRDYPHRQRPPAQPAGQRARFSDADIDRVLARYNQVLDVPRDELRALLEGAETEAYRRRLGELTCDEVMSRNVIAVEFGTPLQEAWGLLRREGIKALPVVDRWRHVVGVVTLADFMRNAELDLHEGFDMRLRRLLRPTPGPESAKPEVVGQIMSRSVRVVSADRALGELVPLFSGTGHHHIPVVDRERRLVGILTQTDLVRALVHRSAETPGRSPA